MKQWILTTYHNGQMRNSQIFSGENWCHKIHTPKLHSESRHLPSGMLPPGMLPPGMLPPGTLPPIQRTFSSTNQVVRLETWLQTDHETKAEKYVYKSRFDYKLLVSASSKAAALMKPPYLMHFDRIRPEKLLCSLIDSKCVISTMMKFMLPPGICHQLLK